MTSAVPYHPWYPLQEVSLSFSSVAGTREETHCYATPYDTIPEMSVGDQTPISIVRTLNRPTVRDKKGDNLYITSSSKIDRMRP